jgi:hypothetical protein
MTDVIQLLAEKRGTPTETAETYERHGFLRKRRVVTGWTIRPYLPAIENALANMRMPDNSWSKAQVRGWRDAYDRLEADVRPAKLGMFLSADGRIWMVDRDRLLRPS